MNTHTVVGLLCILSACVGCGTTEPDAPPSVAEAELPLVGTPAIFAYVDMMTYELKLYDPNTDLEARVDLRTIPGYGGGVPLHAYITNLGQKVYVAFNGDASSPTGIAVVRIDRIVWSEQQIDARLVRKLIVDNPARPNTFPAVSQVVPRQPIQAWTAQPFTQLHGPDELEGAGRLFWTVLTDNRVVTVDTIADVLLPTRQYAEASRSLHGITFNPSGTRGLGAGYFYDRGFLPAFNVSGGELTPSGRIWLGTATSHAAFVHNVEWLGDRFAMVGSMQFARTSLTPADTTILGPSVWLVDSVLQTARRVIGPAADQNDAGVWRSASWVEAVGTKLFVGEEDSLDATFGDDGFVSVFDITNRLAPRFLKRLKPGTDLPADFKVAHALVATPDGRSVILESYPSGYILRINTQTLAVEHVIRSTGDTMPHGGSIVSTVPGYAQPTATYTDGLGL